MKRSEAVDNIACVLVANAPYPQANDMKRISEVAEAIMKDIEERTGMLPPFGVKMEQQNILDRWSQDTGTKEFVRVFVNKWDEE